MARGDALAVVERAHKYLRTKTQKENIDYAFTDNVVSATRPRDFIKKVGGMLVYFHDINPGNVVVSKLSRVGLACFICWVLAFVFCSIHSIRKQQSVIRTNFDTRLKQYGDYCQKALDMTYMLYILWKVPFSLGRDKEHIQQIVDIDLAIRKHFSKKLEYDILGVYALGITVAQIAFAVLQTISLTATQGGLTAKTPIALMFLIIYKDVMALSLTCHYFYYLFLLRQRYLIVLDILRTVLGNPEAAKSSKHVKQTADTLRGCAILYSMLSKGISCTNKLFGMGMVLTIIICLCNIILDLFYLMEANAALLMKKNPSRYIYLMVYVFWEILWAILIIFFNVYSCEKTTTVAMIAPHVLHEIINRDLNPAINTIAMQFSQQLLHQIPLFSAGGLFLINYGILLQVPMLAGPILLLVLLTDRPRVAFFPGARFVSTFIVILLQFVSDPSAKPTSNSDL